MQTDTLKAQVIALGGVASGEGAYVHLFNTHCRNFSNPEDRADAVSILLELNALLRKARIETFPMFGTLLGIVRNDDLIPHDGDIDIGFFEYQLEKLLSLAINELPNHGFYLVRNQVNTLLTIIKRRVMIDFYCYSAPALKSPTSDPDSEPILRQGDREPYDLKISELLPLKEIYFRNQPFLCLRDPIKFFERYYGADWRTPK